MVCKVYVKAELTQKKKKGEMLEQAEKKIKSAERLERKSVEEARNQTNIKAGKW